MPITLEIPNVEPVNALPFLIVCGFILADWVLGISKAFATHTYRSTKMREGLWHKAALIAVMVLAYAMEITTGMMDFSVVGWEPGTTLPISSVVAAYIVLMEAGSAIENIVEINPDLAGRGIWRYFGKLTGRTDDITDTTESHDDENGGENDD